MADKDITALCKAAMSVGVTWEGITNGESCTYMRPTTVGGTNDVVDVAACPPSK